MATSPKKFRFMPYPSLVTCNSSRFLFESHAFHTDIDRLRLPFGFCLIVLLHLSFQPEAVFLQGSKSAPKDWEHICKCGSRQADVWLDGLLFLQYGELGAKHVDTYLERM